MLRFEGDQDFAQPPAEVKNRLTDLNFLAECIPDRESVQSLGNDTLLCTIRPGFSFVRGSLEVRIQIAEVADTRARIHLASRGIGSSSEVEAELTFQPHDSGTRVHWVAEVKNLGGLLKAVPQGLLKAAAQKVISDVWAAAAAKLSR